jgi:SAM-dependent methyltransferase
MELLSNYPISKKLYFSASKQYSMINRIRSKLWNVIQRFRARHAKQSYDADSFWDSYYNIAESHTDATTIALNSSENDPASKYHYNTVENHIYNILIKQGHTPDGKKVLDIGSGAGHWIDFWLESNADSVTGVEISEVASTRLTEKYHDNEQVSINQDNISAPSNEYNEFNYVSAIGVLFHIVEDQAWEDAVSNVCASLVPGGLAFIGGKFGWRSMNVQFHGTDDFETEEELNGLPTGKPKVNKRLRSKSEWKRLVSKCGCEVVDIKRSKHRSHIDMPENNVLAIKKLE